MRQTFNNGQVLLAEQLQQLQDESVIVVTSTSERDALPSSCKTCWLGGTLFIRNGGGSWLALVLDQPMIVARPNAQVTHSLKDTKIPVATTEMTIGTGLSISGGNVVVANPGRYHIVAGFKWWGDYAGMHHGIFALQYGSKSTESYCGGVNPGGTDALSMGSVSTVAYLNAGDTIFVTLYPNSANAFWNTSMDLANSRLTVSRVA